MAEFTVGFWNLQNLFDTTASAIAADLEFTPAEGWTDAVLEQKLDNLAAIINLMHNGGPDLLGLCEVENKEVMERLIAKLARQDYKLAHVDSPDIRGIDTTLVYSSTIFELDGEPVPHLVHLRYPTRDIFQVPLRVKATQDKLTVLVNHWPSRSQGKYESEPYRITVANHCGRIADGILKKSRTAFLALPDTAGEMSELQSKWNENILIMGDLNDEPFDRSVLNELQAGNGEDKIEEPLKSATGHELPSPKTYLGLKAYFFNYMWKFLGEPDRGSYYFSGSVNTMNMLDQFIVSRGLYFGLSGLQVKNGSVDIFRPTVMQSGSKKRPKAFDRKTGKGYSDHFPIVMVLETV